MKILLLVIDGFGLGAFPDALNRGVEIYGKIIKNAKLPTFANLGIYNINNPRIRINPISSYGSLKSESRGTDVITLYFEIAGLYISQRYPAYPEGLPIKLLADLEKGLGTNIIGNIVAEGSRVINDLGALHYNTGFPILYTSSKSILYIAAHEEITPLNKLYSMAEKVRIMMQGENNVARIMASPFNGKIYSFSFTDNNRCYTVKPPKGTMLDILSEKGFKVTAIGKINDLFHGQGITNSVEANTIDKCFDNITESMNKEGNELVFASIETADLSRNDDIKVYTRCLEDIDNGLNKVLSLMEKDDLLFVTSNHSYDYKDESEGYTIPMVIYGGNIKPGINLGVKDGLYSIAHTILDYTGIHNMNKSFLSEVKK
jgi:phosphopentomutase